MATTKTLSTLKLPIRDIPTNNKIVKRIISQLAENVRNEFVILCSENIPQRISLIDGIVAFFIYVKMGFVDLEDFRFINDPEVRAMMVQGEELFTNGLDLENLIDVDNDGRITRLTIGSLFNIHRRYDLPRSIQYLEKLKILSLHNVRSLPIELQNLAHLNELYLKCCTDVSIQKMMKLSQLKFLHIEGCQFQSTSWSLLFFKWMVGQLPLLEHLKFLTLKKNDITCIFYTLLLTTGKLRSYNLSFQDILKKMTMLNCQIDDTMLRTILTKVVPKFPNLSILDLRYNNIERIQSIVNEVEDDSTLGGLQVLDIYGNPVMEKLQNDPMEKAAMLSLLGACNSLYNIGGSSEDTHLGSDIEYAMKINHAGRRIFVEDTSSNNANDGRRRSIPLSLWPSILERAHQKSDQIYSDYRHNPQTTCFGWLVDNSANVSETKGIDPTGLFYLLREAGPVLLFGRPEFSPNYAYYNNTMHGLDNFYQANFAHLRQELDQKTSDKEEEKKRPLKRKRPS